MFLKRPAIAVTLTDSDSLRGIRKAKQVVEARGGIPLLLEIRVDRFRRLDQAWILEKIRSFKRTGLPLIATIRSQKEGGLHPIPDRERLEIFKKILPAVDAIDLELSSARLRKALVGRARRRGKRVIFSYHNFRSTPPDRTLSRLIQRGRRGGADFVKIAVTPKGKKDVSRFLRFTHRNRHRHLISIAMGRHGSPARILAPLRGSLLVYSFLNRPQAPGQIPLGPLCEKLRVFGKK